MSHKIGFFCHLITVWAVSSILNFSAAYAEKGACLESRQGKKTGESLLVLINKESDNQLRPDWAPRDLEEIPPRLMSPNTDQNQLLRGEVIKSFLQMVQAAQKENVSLFVQSGYRSFDNQCQTFASKVSKWTGKFKSASKGLDYARKSSAEPGRSQHQLGTTLDIVFKDLNYKFSFLMTKNKAMSWLDKNAQDYGFVMSYPYADDDHDQQGYNSLTGYYFEPWHWRYIGIESAKAFKASGLTLDRFLESHL